MIESQTSYLGGISHYVGADEASLRLIISIFIGFPLAFIHRNWLYGKSQTQQHVYFICSGFLVGFWNFGWTMGHSLTALCATYLILKYIGATGISIILTMIFNMSYLMWGYWTTSTESYDIMWTMPQCVLVLRLIGLSMNYYDGKQNETKLSDYQKKVSLNYLPSFLEVAAFVYFPGSFLVGPQFSMRRYIDYTNGVLINNNDKQQIELPNSVKTAIKTTLLGFLYLGLFQFGSAWIPTEYLLSNDYSNINFIKKLIYLGFWARFTLYKYIACWLFTEGVCTTFGLSYNGKDKNGNDKWDGCQNVDLLTFENATQFNHYILSFNMNTNHWCAEYIYKRLKFLGSRFASQFFTLAFLAVWHGFHSGYYVCFFNEFMIMFFEKDITGPLMKNEKLQRFINTPIGQITTWCILKIYTFIFMGFAFLPLAVLSYEKYGAVYKTVYYNGYIFFGGSIILLRFIKPLIQGSRTERPHRE